MYWYLNLFLFLITLFGGSLPLLVSKMKGLNMNLLLAFSGAFLLSVTFLHLLPETFEEVGGKAGYFLLIGFFFQLFIQRFTHGAEHGHAHIDDANLIPYASIMLGMCAHAFMEGIPLGFHYRSASTEPSLYMAVAAHKFPEAMLVSTISLAYYKNKTKAWWAVVLFSMITPLASMLASYYGTRYYAMSSVVTYIIPIVAGAYLQIATTIFYESGTKQHMLSWKKVGVILLGVLAGIGTQYFGHGH